jgi:chromosomal replication initiator protein
MDTPINVPGPGGSDGGGRASLERRWTRVMARLRSKVGEDVFSSWFARMEVDDLVDNVLHVTLPTQFLRNWIQNHYRDTLKDCAVAEIEGTEQVQLTVRERGPAVRQSKSTESTLAEGRQTVEAPAAPPSSNSRRAPSPVSVSSTEAPGNGFDGSSLEKKYTFDSFVVGACNRMAHAACKQIAEAPLGTIHYNPLFIHSSVGLGKTHLLHAVAWEVKKHSPNARICYMTAEFFRYRFVEAVRTQGAIAFKDKLRAIDMLLVDDMEFLQGEKTEQEFDHTLNALLDGGKQVIVASARAPMQLDSLDARMRSRLSGGLVTELGAFDHELRLKVLQRRVEEKRLTDPTFSVPDDVLAFLADRITDGGRQLDGTITKLYVACHMNDEPITVERAEQEIRDLLRSGDHRRIRIEDILRVVSKHYGVTRSDILSKRRHRSVVWPRQIGMWLAKNLTARSLPEIGRRFGGRDHTTVLHAIRKIQGELEGNSRLRLEIEDLKRLIDT